MLLLLLLLLLLLMSTSVDAGWIPSSLSLSTSSSSSSTLLSSSSSSSSSSSLSSVTTATSQKKNNKNNNNTPRRRTRTEESSSLSLSSSSKPATTRTIRIRKMIESDIQDISMFLVDGISTTSSSNKKESSIGWQSFKDRIDRLWLQNDISTLLLRRLHAIYAGEKLSMRFQQLMNDDPFFEKEVVEYWTNEQKIDWLWTKGGYDSQRLRELIYRASKDTGELNVWQTPYYNFDISPKDPSWLFHLQITATSSSSSSSRRRRRRTMRSNDSSFNSNNNNNDDDDDEIVVGFCELAMLSNPLLGGLEQQQEQQEQEQQQQQQDDDDGRRERNHDSSTSLSSLSSSSDSLLLLSSSSSSSSFSPAIVNLAVSSQYRRQGIATYLIECSKKYVRQYWKKKNNTDCCLGLYVEQTNYGAIRLYEQTGFRIRTIAPGDGNNRLGDMWYMTCSLS